MCYDISFTVEFNEIRSYFPELVPDDDIELNPDAAVHIIGHSYGLHPIIYSNREDRQLHCRAMEWGCIPYYVKEEKKFVKQRASMLNI